jgi:Flp pilus assembly protein protease CpaA
MVLIDFVTYSWNLAEDEKLFSIEAVALRWNTEVPLLILVSMVLGSLRK